MIITNEGKRLPTITKNGIYGFFGEYRFLCNFHLVNIEIDGIVYPSSEHAYMAQKSLDTNVRKYVAQLPTPSDARQEGQKISLRPDWDTYKDIAMHLSLLKKFEYPDLRDMLLNTQNLYLEETNNWNDTYWGVCNGIGKNMLGKTLMLVREHYKS